MIFAHELALAVGRLDVERMLAEMSPEEFAAWEAFAIVRPFGVLKHAEQAASLLAAQCVEVETEDILRAWGFWLPEIHSVEVMDEASTFAAVCQAMGV